MKDSLKKIINRLLSNRRFCFMLILVGLPVQIVIIAKSGIFDKKWYRKQYPGRRLTWIFNHFPIAHYILLGRKEGLVPSPLFIGGYFDPERWQLSLIDPMVKYLTRRSLWSRPTSILFDPSSGNFGMSMPPLKEYVQSKNTTLFTNKNIESKSIRIEDAYKEIIDSETKRTIDIQERAVANPVYKFNTAEEKRIVDLHKDDMFKKSKNRPLVSIIMPAWNRQELIKDAIESVQRQTLEDWELIIIDDGSTDNTVKVIKSYQENDKRIRLFTPGHGGVCKARNYGLKNANGQWIAFLDSDNTWSQFFLQTMLGYLTSNSAPVGYSAIKMNDNGHVRYRITEYNPKLLETGNYIDLNALVIKSNLLKKVGFFDENLRRMVDYDLVCRISKCADFIYVPIVGVYYVDHSDAARITTTESVSWDGVVKSKNFIDWNGALKNRDIDKISIILPIRGEAGVVVSAIENLLKYTKNKNIEIILADASSNSSTNVSLASLTLLDKRVVHYREQAARDNVLVANYAFAKSRGSTIVVLNQHVKVDEGWLDPLVQAIKENTHSIVGPLQLKPNRTIRSMGVEFYGDNIVPINILEDHPISDVQNLQDIIECDALPNGCFAISAELFAKLYGLNPLYDGGFETQELSLRARKYDKRVRTLMVKNSRIVNPDGGRGWYSKTQEQFTESWKDKISSKTSKMWSLSGFKVISYEKIHPEKNEYSMMKPKLEVKRRHKNTYRWALKISAPADERRFAWGDMYYAEALAEALERKGHKVAIDYLGAHYRQTTYLDDINLDLRGLTPFVPIKDKINILWVISHPDDISIESVKEFDLVYSAGDRWAETMSQRSGKNIIFLPQCTDQRVFYKQPKNKEFSDKILFVGNSRKVLRPIVRDSIAAGLDVAVYGGGWEGLIDKKYIKDTFIPNHKLAQAYGSANVVLNDHWDDMRHWGFVSNRIFDVLAAGGRVLSDDISGIDPNISSSVATYTNMNDLIDIEKKGFDKIFPTKRRQFEIMKYVMKHHSFDKRAEQITKDVLEMKNTNRDLAG